jgi:hypothetical protein
MTASPTQTVLRIFSEDSDVFFNHPEAEDAYHDAEDVSDAVRRLFATADRLIKRGELSDWYAPETYAADFLRRV